MAKRASRKELSHKEHEEHKDCNGRIHAVNQSTFHQFPLVIFVLFVANLFLPDLYQSAISPCPFWFRPKAGLGLSWLLPSLSSNSVTADVSGNGHATWRLPTRQDAASTNVCASVSICGSFF